MSGTSGWETKSQRSKQLQACGSHIPPHKDTGETGYGPPLLHSELSNECVDPDLAELFHAPSFWEPGIVCLTTWPAVWGSHSGQSWPLSFSHSTLQTSDTTQMCLAEVLWWLSNRRAHHWGQWCKVQRTDAGLGASRTILSLTLGRPRSWWWMPPGRNEGSWRRTSMLESHPLQVTLSVLESSFSESDPPSLWEGDIPVCTVIDLM